MSRKKPAAEETVPQNRIGEHNEEKRERFIEKGAVVLTKDDKPDMRIKENREAFMKDTTHTTTDAPDQRFLTNRPDLQKLHEERNIDSPNLLFTNDGELKDE